MLDITFGAALEEGRCCDILKFVSYHLLFYKHILLLLLFEGGRVCNIYQYVGNHILLEKHILLMLLLWRVGAFVMLRHILDITFSAAIALKGEG